MTLSYIFMGIILVGFADIIRSEETSSKQNEDDFQPMKIEFLTLTDLTDSYYSLIEDNYYSEIIGLSIENSNFSHVPTRLLNEFTSLKELTLKNNSFTHFKMERLNSASETMSKNVEHLHIENQDLGTLPNNSFVKYKNLTSLSLVCTAIHTIEEKAFKGLKKLKKLNLTGNLLETLTNHTLSPLVNLEMLSVQNNGFKSLADVFGSTKLVKLKILHMENNPIKGINYVELKEILPNLKRYKYCIGHKKPCENVTNICDTLRHEINFRADAKEEKNHK